jgi:hypothetical protein
MGHGRDSPRLAGFVEEKFRLFGQALHRYSRRVSVIRNDGSLFLSDWSIL